ncbi:MAG: endonuclease III domain-containing protein [Pseudomonadota bacterium]
MTCDPAPTERFMDIYAALLSRFGLRNWWPGDTPFEVCVGAVLTQNTAWKNVAKAISNLKEHSALDPFTIHAMSHERLAELIRPAGYYNVKAKRLRNLIDHLVTRCEGDLDRFFELPTEVLRSELLSVNGVGKETADSIMLYGAGKPIFVVDAYTFRILRRHRIIDDKADYDQVQRLFEERIPRDAALYNDFHAQIVAVGHTYCKRTPLCPGCPLEYDLPAALN